MVRLLRLRSHVGSALSPHRGHASRGLKLERRSAIDDWVRAGLVLDSNFANNREVAGHASGSLVAALADSHVRNKTYVLARASGVEVGVG